MLLGRVALEIGIPEKKNYNIFLNVKIYTLYSNFSYGDHVYSSEIILENSSV